MEAGEEIDHQELASRAAIIGQHKKALAGLNTMESVVVVFERRVETRSIMLKPGELHLPVKGISILPFFWSPRREPLVQTSILRVEQVVQLAQQEPEQQEAVAEKPKVCACHELLYFTPSLQLYHTFPEIPPSYISE
jgi:hypothetical protein